MSAPHVAAIAAPFDGFRARVEPQWIDANGHLNMAYYVLIFDYATDAWFEWLGLGPAHRTAAGVTTFCLESHVTYQREVREGDPLRVTTRLLAFDAKRLHYFHEMSHAGEGYLAATNELMSLHVSQLSRRATPMATEILARLADVQTAHDVLPRAPQIGRVMGLAAGSTTHLPASARGADGAPTAASARAAARS
jgi:acyl-CoA thioester hydrolase